MANPALQTPRMQASEERELRGVVFLFSPPPRWHRRRRRSHEYANDKRGGKRKLPAEILSSSLLDGGGGPLRPRECKGGKLIWWCESREGGEFVLVWLQPSRGQLFWRRSITRNLMFKCPLHDNCWWQHLTGIRRPSKFVPNANEHKLSLCWVIVRTRLYRLGSGFVEKLLFLLFFEPNKFLNQLKLNNIPKNAARLYFYYTFPYLSYGNSQPLIVSEPTPKNIPLPRRK